MSVPATTDRTRTTNYQEIQTTLGTYESHQLCGNGPSPAICLFSFYPHSSVQELQQLFQQLQPLNLYQEARPLPPQGQQFSRHIQQEPDRSTTKPQGMLEVADKRQSDNVPTIMTAHRNLPRKEKTQRQRFLRQQRAACKVNFISGHLRQHCDFVGIILDGPPHPAVGSNDRHKTGVIAGLPSAIYSLSGH
ncbi:hypothetical protein M0657_001937 [Pyricularia oryzae]|nr:hypothetical protein M9X92_002761 [Pyricularia oryzae]KAI7929790.1 hypothetical protein M0657_001937 [Pyricularia oryzae]